jgi:hypothetical protein
VFDYHVAKYQGVVHHPLHGNTDIGWNIDEFLALQKYLYSEMEADTTLPYWFVPVVESLEDFSVRVSFPPVLPAQQAAEFRKDWKAKNDAYYASLRPKDTDMSEAPAPSPSPPSNNSFTQSSFFGSSINSQGLSSSFGSSNGSSATFGSSATGFGSSGPFGSSAGTLASSFGSSNTSLSLGQSTASQSVPTQSSSNLPPTSGTSTAVPDTSDVAMGSTPQDTSTKSALGNGNSNAVDLPDPVSKSLAAFMGESTKFNSHTMLVDTLSDIGFIGDIMKERMNLTDAIRQGLKVTDDEIPLLWASISRVWNANNDPWFNGPAIKSEAKHWYSSMFGLMSSLKSFGANSLQKSDVLSEFNDMLEELMGWLNGIATPTGSSEAPAPGPPAASSGSGGPSGSSSDSPSGSSPSAFGGAPSGGAAGPSAPPSGFAPSGSAAPSGPVDADALSGDFTAMMNTSSAVPNALQPTPSNAPVAGAITSSSGSSMPSSLDKGKGVVMSQTALPKSLASFENDGITKLDDLSSALKNPVFLGELTFECASVTEMVTKQQTVSNDDMPLLVGSLRTVFDVSEDADWFDGVALASYVPEWHSAMDALASRLNGESAAASRKKSDDLMYVVSDLNSVLKALLPDFSNLPLSVVNAGTGPFSLNSITDVYHVKAMFKHPELADWLMDARAMLVESITANRVIDEESVRPFKTVCSWITHSAQQTWWDYKSCAGSPEIAAVRSILDTLIVQFLARSADVGDPEARELQRNIKAMNDRLDGIVAQPLQPRVVKAPKPRMA